MDGGRNHAKAPSNEETELQKGQRWLMSLTGGNEVAPHHNVAPPHLGHDMYQQVQMQGARSQQHFHPQLPHANAQQQAFELALRGVRSVQAATSAPNLPSDLEKREGMLQAEEQSLQARMEAHAMNEQRIATDYAVLDARKREAAVASGVADQRERALNQLASRLDLRDSDVTAREELATRKESALRAREEAFEEEVRGWLQQVETAVSAHPSLQALSIPSMQRGNPSPLARLPHVSPRLPLSHGPTQHVGSKTVDHEWCSELISNQQLDRQMGDVLELIEFMDGVEDGVDSDTLSEPDQRLDQQLDKLVFSTGGNQSVPSPRQGGVYMNGASQKEHNSCCYPSSCPTDATPCAMTNRDLRVGSTLCVL